MWFGGPAGIAQFVERRTLGREVLGSNLPLAVLEVIWSVLLCFIKVHLSWIFMLFLITESFYGATGFKMDAPLWMRAILISGPGLDLVTIRMPSENVTAQPCWPNNPTICNLVFRFNTKAFCRWEAQTSIQNDVIQWNSYGGGTAGYCVQTALFWNGRPIARYGKTLVTDFYHYSGTHYTAYIFQITPDPNPVVLFSSFSLNMTAYCKYPLSPPVLWCPLL